MMNAAAKLSAVNDHASHCRLCGAGLKHSLVDLGMSPLCETFLTPAQCDEMEAFFPLHVLVCDSCWLVQLKEYVTPDGIFTSEYPYYSSYSTSWVAHAKAYCEKMRDRFALNDKSLVVELASNDGYLLQHFVAMGVPVLGIEPSANVAEVARGKGIESLVDFFGVRLAKKLVAEGRRADVIAGNNVLAHVPDINDFVAGAATLIKPDGVITFEFPHLEKLIAENQFDTIYHEHFSYLSAVVIERLASMHDLVFFDVEELASHGGSLRVFLSRKGSSRTPSQAVIDLIAREKKAGFCEMSFYAPFAEKVKETKRKLLAFLIQAKADGKKVVGYGAPGKGNTLLNYCGIGTDFIDFTVDRNEHKHGRFTPGTLIPVLPVSAIDEAKPDYILILPWNLKKEIVKQMAHVSAWGAKFVVPIPEATILDPKDFQ